MTNKNVRMHNLWQMYYILYMQTMLAKFRMLWVQGTFSWPAHKQNTAIVYVLCFCIFLSVFLMIYCVAGSEKWGMRSYELSSVCLRIHLMYNRLPPMF